MVIPMLEAVSEMLNDDASSAELFMTKVQCAKTLLDKIIEGMQTSQMISTRLSSKPQVDIEDIEEIPTKPNPPKQHIPPPIPEGQYQIEMNPDFTLRAINGTPPLPLDAPIELDGRVTVYKDVIGKAYNTIKIL